MPAVWRVLLSFALILTVVKSQGGNITDECLILASSHEGGVSVTTTLKSGFTETHHFPNITLLPCGSSTRCPVITVDQADQVNINETVAIVMIERGLLLLKLMYYSTSTSGPRLELTNSYTLPLECIPLALIPDEMGFYLLVCGQDSTIGVRRLIMNRTVDLSQSKETLLFENDILPSNLNRTVLSNFLASSEDQIFFAYKENIYHIRQGRLETTRLGPLTPGCEYATRIVLDTSRGEIIAYCPSIVVLFDFVMEGTWRTYLTRLEQRKILCSAESLPQNYTILDTERDMLIELYGQDELCIQKNSHSFFIYREKFAPFNTLIIDLRMKMLSRLTKEDCSADENILTIDNRYLIVADLSMTGLCYIKLFDVCRNFTAPIVMQFANYSSIGVVSGFTRVYSNEPTTNSTPNVTERITEGPADVTDTQTTSQTTSDSTDIAFLAFLPLLVPIFAICIVICIQECIKRSKKQATDSAVTLTTLRVLESQPQTSTPGTASAEIIQRGSPTVDAPHPSVTITPDNDQAPTTTENKFASPVPTPPSNSLSSPALTNPPMSAQELVLATNQQSLNCSDRYNNSASIELATSDGSQEHAREDVKILQNPPGGMESAYGYEITIDSPKEAQNGTGAADVVIGRQAAHPPDSFDNHSVAANANRHQTEDARNRTNARVQQL